MANRALPEVFAPTDPVEFMHSRLLATLSPKNRPRREGRRRLAPLRLVVVRPRAAKAVLTIGTRSFACAIGENGLAGRKREGDGATPVGRWPMRAVFYRAGRIRRPAGASFTVAVSPHDGWCDDPASRAYNRPIVRPFAPRHEVLWREDNLYDLVIVLGYNDAPVVRGAGSAIFVHTARHGLAPTEGCIALARRDLVLVAALASPRRDFVVAGSGR